MLTIFFLFALLYGGKCYEHLPNIILPLNLVSNCSHAFGMGSFKQGSSPIAKSFLNLSLNNLPPGFNSKLNVVNAGFGTTATHAVYHANKLKYGDGCHYALCRYPEVKHLVDSLHHCVYDSIVAKEDWCRTDKWLELAREVVMILVKSEYIHHVIDTPIGILFGEFLALLPGAIYQQSLRNPITWAVKRLAEYHDDVICAPHLNSAVPFNVLECMQGSAYLSDNLVTLSQYTTLSSGAARQYLFASLSRNSDVIKQLREDYPEAEQRFRNVAMYYVAYNRYILSNVPNLDRYLPICMWDNPDLS